MTEIDPTLLESLQRRSAEICWESQRKIAARVLMKKIRPPYSKLAEVRDYVIKHAKATPLVTDVERFNILSGAAESYQWHMKVDLREIP